MKRLKKLTRAQKEFLATRLGVNSTNYLVERNTSEFTIFYNTKTNEKIIYHKTFDSIVDEIQEVVIMFVVPKKRHDRVVEEKNNEIENLKKRIKHLESEGELKTKKLNETTYKLNCKAEQISKLLIDNCCLNNELEDKNREIVVVRTLITLEADNKIKRYENIKSRTKKTRIKEKCERKIEDYMMRKLAYSKEQ